MKTTRSFLSIFLIAIVTGLLMLGWVVSSNGYRALAQETKSMDTQPVTNKEYARNGTFDLGKTGWYIAGTGSGVDNVGQDGGPAMSMEAIMETQATIYQELHLPSQTTAATFAFDYRLLPTYGGVAQFYAGIATETGIIANVLTTPYIYGDTGWQKVDVSLRPTDVAQVQAVHAAGQRVYVIFTLLQNPANAFKAYLDNISFKVSGSMDYPTLSGSIAYIGLDNDGNSKMVNRIDPDGSDQQTLWTHPGPVPSTNIIFDVAWKPDASELAFSSNHEDFYSAFNSDVYGIKPDGSSLRRITNPPSKAEIDAGKYQMGIVTGKIFNNYGRVASFFVYIEGAQEAVSVFLGGYNEETSFTVENVADLGAGVSRYVVFCWSSLHCDSGREYAAAIVDVIPGQTVDVGTLTFHGYCNEYHTTDISWKRDGSQVGFSVGGIPRKVQATGEAIGTELFNATLAYDLAWSPADDQKILYRRDTGDASTSGIYQTKPGGDAGSQLVANDITVGFVGDLAWLPAGSGFVYGYVAGGNLHQYDLSSSQMSILTNFYNESAAHPSLSPDGKHIVFERVTYETIPAQWDLWIMNRTNPVEMWQLTNDGKSSNPDWSRQ